VDYDFEYQSNDGERLYERPTEVLSIELLGNSSSSPSSASMLRLLGFPHRDVVLFTAPDDYRQVALPVLSARRLEASAWRCSSCVALVLAKH
jgi:hypothetical protein